MLWNIPSGICLCYSNVFVWFSVSDSKVIRFFLLRLDLHDLSVNNEALKKAYARLLVLAEGANENNGLVSCFLFFLHFHFFFIVWLSGIFIFFSFLHRRRITWMNFERFCPTTNASRRARLVCSSNKACAIFLVNALLNFIIWFSQL